MGMGDHQSAKPGSIVWLTPPHVLNALGGWESFDLDPCAAPAPRPWPTALHMNSIEDGDGLALPWWGRVFLNPDYRARQIAAWLWKLAGHGQGTALIFARTETETFRRTVWERAHGLLFLYGRLRFHRPDGSRARDGGAPSVLVAYGEEDMDRLACADLPGSFVPIRLPRFVLVDLPPGTWREEMRAWLEQQGGPVTVSETYRHFARHPVARRNRHVRAKVRQQLQLVGDRVAPATYQLRR